jgi:hypothetical protein
MNRRLLLTVAGLGTSAAAVFLMAGTAHALAPPPTVRPPMAPVHLIVPAAPDRSAPDRSAPDRSAGGVATVKTVTTKVAHEVRQVPPVEKVVGTVPVVVKRVTATLDHSVPMTTVVVHRALPASSLGLARSRQSTKAHAPAFTNASSRHTTAQMRSPRTRQTSHSSTVAFVVPGLTDNALSPARSSIGSPFASLTTRTPRVSTAAQWLTFPTPDRTRPGFLVGSARPG